MRYCRRKVDERQRQFRQCRRRTYFPISDHVARGVVGYSARPHRYSRRQRGPPPRRKHVGCALLCSFCLFCGPLFVECYRHDHHGCLQQPKTKGCVPKIGLRDARAVRVATNKPTHRPLFTRQQRRHLPSDRASPPPAGAPSAAARGDWRWRPKLWEFVNGRQHDLFQQPYNEPNLHPRRRPRRRRRGQQQRLLREHAQKLFPRAATT